MQLTALSKPVDSHCNSVVAAVKAVVLRAGALLALSLAAMGMPAGAHDRPPRLPEPLVCGAGQLPCRGPFGSVCFVPSRGETCTQGLVCGAGQSACVGRYGQACFLPARGDTCQQGLVCGVGQALCATGGQARCYTPSRGETCR